MTGRNAGYARVEDDRFVEWARRIQRSDAGAFRELFESIHVHLIRFAWRYTFDEETARDLVQDALLKIWQMRSTLDEHRSLRALLYVMVRNSALNHRRAHRELRHPQSVDSRWEPEGDVSLEEDADARMLAQRLDGWIDQLPDRRREAFVLSRFHGMTHEEIASLMGLTSRTVNTHIVLALKDLRGRLEVLELHERT